MRTPTHTIATDWIKIDGEDRLRVKIDVEHDFATLYLHPETAKALRVALGAVPERAASEAPLSAYSAFDVKIDDQKIRDVSALTDYDAIYIAAQHVWPDMSEIKWIDADDFEGFLPFGERKIRVRFTATATPSTTEIA